ncbi:MAG: aldose epimerase family protein [Armatimonadota bacterium]|nr:aldose epimerase family protein [Armatimonadota bacterium]
MSMVVSHTLVGIGLSLAWAGANGQDGMIVRERWGASKKKGLPIDLFTLRNGRGMEARITNYGGIVVSLTAPDRRGHFADVVLGYDRLDDYVTDNPFFGALVGRYANRIGGARFILDGVEYRLAANDGRNHLHGGRRGFDKVVWDATERFTPAGPALELRYLSRDGEEGYPGNLQVCARYTLTHDGTLRIELSATTDRPTICNLTQHSYFNLKGAGEGDILDHLAWINADFYTPTDAEQIPTGEILAVGGTPLDFRSPTPIGSRIDAPHEAIRFGHGYDHNWVLRERPVDHQPVRAARVWEPVSGRVLEVFTTAPGVQFYTGNFLDGHHVGKQGVAYGRRAGFCLEPQHYPDSPNKPHFPSPVLRPGEEYRHTIVYRFDVE